MKTLLVFTLCLITEFCQAQLNLDAKDLNNLIALSLLYSKNPNANGKAFSKSADSLRTPTLDHIVDALIAVGKGDKSIIDTRFLTKPSYNELVLWYVMREIHYNRVNEKQKPRPDNEVADEVLSHKIDERWLLDNYYYRLHGGIASLFNEADLRTDDINIKELGFSNSTEKAIFFLNMIDALVGSRIRVLQKMKNNQAILDFCDKLPKFDGKEYFFYKDFNYEDFEWIGYDKKESYNERNLGTLYNVLIAHFNATAQLRDKKNAQDIYFNSILFEPKYFKYTDYKDDLKSIYEKSTPAPNATNTNAEYLLHFDKRYVQCEDQWVAFPMNKDGGYDFGFIYIDNEAGLTLNYEGSFTINSQGTYLPKKSDTASLKIRLEPSQKKVAIIPSSKYQELQITRYPDWLKLYKTDTNSVQRLFRWGFLYNSWGECALAIPYLEKAKSIDPSYKGLEFELAYAYNDLQQFENALTASKSAIAQSPNDCYAFKELSFAQMYVGDLVSAAETCKQGISVCDDNQLKCEIAYNMAHQYYKAKDKDNFKIWADEAKKWGTTGSPILGGIEKMEAELSK